VANYLHSILGNTLSGGRTMYEMRDARRVVLTPYGEYETPRESVHDVDWRKVELSVSLQPTPTPPNRT